MFSHFDRRIPCLKLVVLHLLSIVYLTKGKEGNYLKSSEKLNLYDKVLRHLYKPERSI